MRRVPYALAGFFGLLCLGVTLDAAAQEDGELRLMKEPHSYTDVVDAFDDEDPFDINVTVGYRHEYTYGNIQREGNVGASDPNRASQNWVDVAHHTHTRNILDLGLDVGIFRDLAVYGRLPLILSDERRLTAHAGGASLLEGPLVDNCALDSDGNCIMGSGPDGIDDLMPGVPQPPIFAAPFQSPTRSGLDYVAAGLAWSIFNHHRERELPTWILMIEGRFNLGDPLTACRGGATAQCAVWSETGGDWTRGLGTDAGETRGTNALRIETRSSWRTRYVEPFAGLLFQVEWPANAERLFLPAGSLNGIVNERPPMIGQFTGGMAIIPWENRAQFQRFAIDVRVMGKYVSEGHGYSPLFDALGTSDNRYLTQPNLEGEAGGGANLRQVPFVGLTDMAPHAEMGAHLGVEMRAARFVRFTLEADLWYVAPYVITYADACNPNFEAQDPDDPRVGTCRRGVINPHHRPVLDLPGRNFRVDEQVRLQLQVNVTGMF